MSDYVSVAEHELLKMKCEYLESNHEKLIQILERLEDLYGFTIDDMVKTKEELLMEKTLEMVDESEMNGINSGGSRRAEKRNVKKNVLNYDVIVISDDDDDEENHRKSSRRGL